MPFYLKQGHIPAKRHTVFKKYDGSLLYEELMSREGFSYVYSNLYHIHMPTQIIEIGKLSEINFKFSKDKTHRPRHIRTSQISSSGDIVSSRKLLFFNQDLNIYKSHVSENMSYIGCDDNFYKNGTYDELIYIQEGEGVIKTQLGDITYKNGDYLVIPRGIIWKMIVSKDSKILIIESVAPIETPSKYRNRVGQLLEHSPFCERDIKTPELSEPINKSGRFLVKVRTDKGIQDIFYAKHPFDVVGWDGYYFPWKLNIDDFEPIVGSIHQPPPVHQVFQSRGFVICSFVSRLFDFHPQAIPAPYPHSNVDSDEVLFYSKGDFMSRKGIQAESISYHPMGIPHGPHPGKYEASIGKKSTDELAVMVDTFKPLNIASDTDECDDSEYPKSWIL
tara:strand:+ start:3904 stop:5073 length:1170 start_codon:yes stop_codon:yes gene_type:complete